MVETEFKPIYSSELVNKLSLFGASPFMCRSGPLGPTEADKEKLTFEKSLEEKTLTFRHVASL